MRKHLTVLLFLTGLLAAIGTAPAHAQSAQDGLGIGAQLGDPSGLTLKVDGQSAMDWEFLAAFDLDDFFFLNVHGVFSHRLDTETPLYLTYGPGGFIGFIDRASQLEDDIGLGISGMVGVNYHFDQFEVFVRATPRLQVLPGTGGEMGGGVGFRYYP